MSWKVPPPPQLGFSAQHLWGAGAPAQCGPRYVGQSVRGALAGPYAAQARCYPARAGDLKSGWCWCWGSGGEAAPPPPGAAACAGRPPSRLAANSKKCFQQNYETAVRTFISKSRLDRGTIVVTLHSSPCNMLTRRVTMLISPEDTWLS